MRLFVVQKDRAAIERHDRAEGVGDGAEQRIARQVEDDRIVDGQQRPRTLGRLQQLLLSAAIWLVVRSRSSSMAARDANVRSSSARASSLSIGSMSSTARWPRISPDVPTRGTPR